VRIVSYRSERGARAGVLHDARIVDAWDALGGETEAPSVRALLEQGLVAEVGERATGDGLGLDEVELLPPVPEPDKIVCIGLNYRSHAEEAGQEVPSEPTFFAKFRNALVPSGAEVALPASEKVDYEAELAFVVGRPCKDVPVERGLDHVAGYTLLNDLSARDWQFATPQWMRGKVFDGSAPCGPALVTPDEAGPHDSIEIELRLNGETMQKASTADLIFPVPELVARLSRLMTLVPGDIVSTGTPAGVGSVRRPRVWLRPGDHVVVRSPSIGELTTWVVNRGGSSQ
jgi:2-keto-4-pentenoate hydratase/2-oxohepta-3-ene-1,7-dioic acid hydratase in catechol pathway